LNPLVGRHAALNLQGDGRHGLATYVGNEAESAFAVLEGDAIASAASFVVTPFEGNERFALGLAEDELRGGLGTASIEPISGGEKQRGDKHQASSFVQHGVSFDGPQKYFPDGWKKPSKKEWKKIAN
jgi:hypothetical protein